MKFREMLLNEYPEKEIDRINEEYPDLKKITNMEVCHLNCSFKDIYRYLFNQDKYRNAYSEYMDKCYQYFTSKDEFIFIKEEITANYYLMIDLNVETNPRINLPSDYYEIKRKDSDIVSLLGDPLLNRHMRCLCQSNCRSNTTCFTLQLGVHLLAIKKTYPQKYLDFVSKNVTITTLFEDAYNKFIKLEKSAEQFRKDKESRFEIVSELKKRLPESWDIQYEYNIPEHGYDIKITFGKFTIKTFIGRKGLNKYDISFSDSLNELIDELSKCKGLLYD